MGFGLARKFLQPEEVEARIEAVTLAVVSRPPNLRP